MIKVVHLLSEANCVTHSGTMHADEVFATAFLEWYLGDIKVFRTNSVTNSLVDDDVLIYDIGRGKFDHHQGDALKRENGITYSSFGLLWKEFGRDFLTQNGYDDVDDMFSLIDKDFVEGIDGDDNGVFPKIECNYSVKTLPNIIKIFNPSFDSYENEDDQFLKAVHVARMIFEEEVLYIHGKVLANKKIQAILDNRNLELSYLILDEYLPYEDILLSREDASNIMFVAFPSNRGGYAIKTIPKSVDDKTARMMFPEDWAGLFGSELEEKAGIKGLRFCHTGRFIVSCDDLQVVYQVLNILCK